MAEGPPRLVVVTRGDAHERGAQRVAAELRDLADAGLAGVILREPELEDGALLALAAELRPHLAWLSVHDRVHVARAAGADAAHLGWRSLDLAAARRAAGHLALGLSTHAEDDAATWAGADYLVHGPVAPTPSKQGLVEPVGVVGFAAGRARRPDPEVPMLALGGVTGELAPELLAAGAHGVAVIGAVLGAEEPRRALLDLASAVG